MPDAHVVGSDGNAGADDRNEIAAIVLEGTKGTAKARFDAVAACLEGGQAHVSKRGVAFVVDGNKSTPKSPSATVGDGAVAVTLRKGTSVCFQKAVAVAIDEGHVVVAGLQSVGVLLDPSADSTGTLPGKREGQSLLLFADHQDDGSVRWVVGVSGKAKDTVSVQDGLACGTPYKLDGGKLVKA